MAKAQPVMSFTFDIFKKDIEELTSVLTDFGYPSTVTGVLKKANVNIKELKTKLASDPKLMKQIQTAMKFGFEEQLKSIMEDPSFWDVGNDITYLDAAAGAVNIAFEQIVAEKQSELRQEKTASDIKAAVELLKKAGYKVSE
jgi:hypothetical protein